MEQLFDGSPYDNRLIHDNINQADAIWDYDEENVNWLKENLNIDAVFHPLVYVNELKNIPSKSYDEHDIDILFYGYPNERRFKIIEEFCKELWRTNISVVTLYNCYGEQLNDFISRSKIVLNVHFFETSRQEQARLFYLITNGKCIVSEKSPKNYLGECVNEEPVKMLSKRCRHLIESGRWWTQSQNNSEKFKEMSEEIKKNLP